MPCGQNGKTRGITAGGEDDERFVKVWKGGFAGMAKERSSENVSFSEIAIYNGKA